MFICLIIIHEFGHFIVARRNKVKVEEFEELKAVEHHKVITESRLDGAEVAIVFAPRKVWPPIMKTLKLWK